MQAAAFLASHSPFINQRPCCLLILFLGMKSLPLVRHNIQYITFVVEDAEYKLLTIPIQEHPNVAVYISASSAIDDLVHTNTSTKTQHRNADGATD
ncbi:uncharacterized protein EURHEDRAFT_264931 [Aspergillus ruber CBS 135680]|uniref:Uncharacterized protein n=1 Tax=Aspergillus ruber (strain CBS 135680) TaxID=1388766 RepID=A0A017SMX4_ASPRC|nr:uncharacterized protein EURHEDRAFT_264931 [Aspergillus ruber CBS 135680]EYE97969.1 hypothetical protein EURHEDRAFT_264931 [Aspergillus ruber CBS 135680]